MSIFSRTQDNIMSKIGALMEEQKVCKCEIRLKEILDELDKLWLKLEKIDDAILNGMTRRGF